ncbi:hypothetical protein U5640_22750 [Streptomyces sp. SS7]|uniref:hypothetical protein n=1 Tax=Streptomyces sp. SS7 TaxID=3108485 RepID=UPI0030EC2DAF
MCIVGPGSVFVLCERPVQRGDRGAFARVLASLDGEPARDLGDGDATVPQCAGEQQRVVVDDLGPSAVVALGGRSLLSLQDLLADVVAVGWAATASTAKNIAPCRWVADAGERAGEEFELHVGGLELAGESHQLGGVAGKMLEFVDGEDELLVGGASLMSYASLRAFSSSGRVLMRVEIFSEKIRLQSGSSAASCGRVPACPTPSSAIPASGCSGC